jgi:serine protease inhibitor
MRRIAVVVLAAATIAGWNFAAGAQDVTEATTQFGLKLFQELVRDGVEENVFISPLSIATALSMTWNGAAGTTATAMAGALEFSDMSTADANRSFAETRNSLMQADPKVKLSIANSLWGRKGKKFNTKYLGEITKAYAAQFKTVAFGKPEAARAINAWVKAKTSGKIPTIVNETRSDDALYLINAIYFKGKWAEPFDKDLTRNRSFYPAKGPAYDVPMMAQSGEYRHSKGEGFEAVRLPYGKDRIAMYVFLPDQKAGLSGLLADLDAKHWEKWLGSFRHAEGDIVLPRFKITYDTTLQQSLAKLGMDEAFDPMRADFSKMVARDETGVFISSVRHKTFVEVNEEGTEAAAVTSVQMTDTAVPSGGRFSMVVDRPFVCAIRDDATGALLFLGTIVKP